MCTVAAAVERARGTQDTGAAAAADMLAGVAALESGKRVATAAAAGMEVADTADGLRAARTAH